MPYITINIKEALLTGASVPQCAGDLNYLFTMAAIQYVEYHGLSYQILNDVIGALTAAKDEFTRRVVIPYEDKKIKINGDVYPDFSVIK